MKKQLNGALFRNGLLPECLGHSRDFAALVRNFAPLVTRMNAKFQASRRESFGSEPKSCPEALCHLCERSVQGWKFFSQILPQFAAMRGNQSEVSEMPARLIHACQEILQRCLVQARQLCRIRRQLCQPLQRVTGIGPFPVRVAIALEFRFDQECIDG